jgi:hypothetical protein
MAEGTALALLGHQAVAAEEVTDGRAGRPGSVGLTGTEDRPPLLGAPGGIPAPCVKECRHHRVRRMAGRGSGPTRVLFEALGAVGELAVKPLVPGLAADTVECAALGHGQAFTPIISEELRVLVHGRCVAPGHGAPP